MVITGVGESLTGNSVNYDRFQELKAFDDSKASVKGLVDASIAKLPRIFVRPPEEVLAGDPIPSKNTQFTIPVIDLSTRRYNVVAGVRCAAEAVGFFQVVNHGISFANWRDTLFCVMGPHLHPLQPQELPPLCRSSSLRG
uniref:Non-haem dioxygenase N-terminal domain-containing protein n=1 Tax=Fagus sylvatica TaxID=28930 RepID=A0A2N9GR04_FAGSY